MGESLLNEDDSSDDQEGSSDESSEEEMQTQGDKSWDVALRELFLDPLQNPIYKATMGVGRYENIRCFLRFDDRRTRALRLETDHMAAFTYAWECFLDNCRRRFIPSDCVTIDKWLLVFNKKDSDQYLLYFDMAEYRDDGEWILVSRGRKRNQHHRRTEPPNPGRHDWHRHHGRSLLRMQTFATDMTGDLTEARNAAATHRSRGCIADGTAITPNNAS
ncbi:hypothetical protein D4764_17G0007540 [Takifugu flavidus]|uniref:Uncharacterized protein n=1 Tax=Takifugu flavidus TaxID=433684 RepID=A0A5C6NXC6_9TELE|nr:hypothetical protein D4764_17G0007540 [Takifugu flavidus]